MPMPMQCDAMLWHIPVCQLVCMYVCVCLWGNKIVWEYENEFNCQMVCLEEQSKIELKKKNRIKFCLLWQNIEQMQK